MALARAAGFAGSRASRVSKATISAARSRRRAGGARNRRHAARTASPRSSPPTPISAPARSRRRSMRAPTSSSPAASPIRSGARSADPCLRLGLGRLAAPRRRHARRASARMRQPDDRRLFRRSAVQGRAGHGRARLSDRRDRYRRRDRDHQAGRTGGRVDRQTVIEQILYEIHDPAAYLTPDVVLDLTEVEVAEIGAGPCARRRRARQACVPRRSRPRCASRAACSAKRRFPMPGRMPLARARLAAETIRARMKRRAPELVLRVDAVGVTACSATAAARSRPCLRLRPKSGCASPRNRQSPPRIELLLDEVEALYCAGPAGGAGVRRAHHAAARQRLLPDRAGVRRAPVTFVEVRHEQRHGPFHRLANARSGDKGNRLNIALVCRDPRALFASIARKSTAERVAAHFAAPQPAGSRATSCQNCSPSISSSMTCWKAESMRASASTATASRCRSSCSA